MGGTHHQLGSVLCLGHPDQSRGHIGADHFDVPTAQIVEQGAILHQTLGSGAGQVVVCAHMHADEFGLRPHGHAGRTPDQHSAAARAGERDHHPLFGLPRSSDVVALAIVGKLLVDPIGHPQESQLAERSEVAGSKIVAERGVDALGRIHVSMGQPPAQRLGSHVDQFYLVGAPDHRVRHRLLLCDAGDLLHDVVERFQMLEVDGRYDVDAGIEDLLDVLPAFGMLRAGRIGVGQLVDQHEFGLAVQQSVDVHLFEGLAPVVDDAPRKDLQVADLSVRVRPAVILHPTDYHVGAALLPPPSLIEHGVGLAHSRGCAEIQPQLSSCHRRWPPDPRSDPLCPLVPGSLMRCAVSQW